MSNKFSAPWINDPHKSTENLDRYNDHDFARTKKVKNFTRSRVDTEVLTDRHRITLNPKLLIPPDHLKTPKQRKRFYQDITIYIAIHIGGASFRQIAEDMGLKSKSSVEDAINRINKFKESLEND